MYKVIPVSCLILALVLCASFTSIAGDSSGEVANNNNNNNNKEPIILSRELRIGLSGIHKNTKSKAPCNEYFWRIQEELLEDVSSLPNELLESVSRQLASNFGLLAESLRNCIIDPTIKKKNDMATDRTTNKDFLLDGDMLAELKDIKGKAGKRYLASGKHCDVMLWCVQSRLPYDVTLSRDDLFRSLVSKMPFGHGDLNKTLEDCIKKPNLGAKVMQSTKEIVRLDQGVLRELSSIQREHSFVEGPGRCIFFLWALVRTIPKGVIASPGQAFSSAMRQLKNQYVEVHKSLEACSKLPEYAAEVQLMSADQAYLEAAKTTRELIEEARIMLQPAMVSEERALSHINLAKSDLANDGLPLEERLELSAGSVRAAQVALKTSISLRSNVQKSLMDSEKYAQIEWLPKLATNFDKP